MKIRLFVLAAAALFAAGCAGSPNYVFGAQTRADNVKLGVTSASGEEQGIIECDMDQQGKTYNCRRMTINYED